MRGEKGEERVRRLAMLGGEGVTYSSVSLMLYLASAKTLTTAAYLFLAASRMNPSHHTRTGEHITLHGEGEEE